MKCLRFCKAFFFGLYERTLRWSKTRYAAWGLAVVAFAESSFFPIPPDVLLIPMVVSKPANWRRNAIIATSASVMGGIFGYFIGWSFYMTAGQKIVEFYGLEQAVEAVRISYANNAYLTIFTAAFTPIPYKVFTISAGLFRIPLLVLIIASVLGRGARFFAIALLLRIFGERIKHFIKKYFNILSIIFVVLLIGGFIALKFLF